MKKILKRISLFALLIAINCSCQDGCYSDYYQIKKVTEIGNGMCVYRSWGIGSRYNWTDLSVVDFEDSCNAYKLSQILPRTTLEKKYGFDCSK